jgi:hypothetical protein
MPATVIKTCAHCHATKTAEGFYHDKSHKHGLTSWCKECSLAKQRAALLGETPEEREARLKRSSAWQKANPERVATYARKRTKAHHGGLWPPNVLASRKSKLLKHYSLTLEDYDRMLEEQGGGCAICRTVTPGRGKRSFCVDHDHNDGRIRGLLCMNCNCALGFFQDDIRLIGRAIAYLGGTS